jgi:hypothetical protein
VGPEWDFVATGDYVGDAKTEFLMYNTGTAVNGDLSVGSIDASGAASYTWVGAVASGWEFRPSRVELMP